jgi:hypothetical protein
MNHGDLSTHLPICLEGHLHESWFDGLKVAV